MTSVEITSLMAGIFHIILTLFVLSRDWRSPTNRVYFLWGMSLIVWNLGVFISSRAQYYGDEFVGGIAVRLIHLALVFVPISGFHLYLLTAQVRWRWTLRLLYVLHFLFALAVFTPWYIVGLKKTSLGYYAVGGPLSHLFLAILSIVSLTTIGLLYHRQRKLSVFYRTRLRALLLGFVILFLAGLNDFAPLFAQDYYPGTHIPFRPVANLASLFFAIIVSYAVLQHQLLDIRLALGRLAAQLVRLSYMFLTSFILLLALRGIAPDQLPPFALFSALGVLLVTFGLASFLFPRFFGRGEEKLERWILGDQFEYQDQIRGFIQRIPSYTQTDLLFDDLHELLIKTIRVNHYLILLWDEGKRTFSLFRSHPPCPLTQVPELTLDSPILSYFSTTKADYFANSKAYLMPGATALDRPASQQLHQFGMEICIPFIFREVPFGMLLLGEKARNEPYTGYDLQILLEMAKNLRLVLNQIRLTHQVLLAEEMELLGRMSRGMAHDLNNLLTTVWTYVQLARESPITHPGMAKLLPSVIRNVETIRAYVKEAHFISEHHTPQFQLIRLDVLIRKTIDLIESRLQRKKLSIQLQSQSEARAEIDEILLQRLIGNLLGNAIDASPSGSVINIQLVQLPKSEADRDWLRLRIIDQGSGISAENLKRIATPYFTTKDHGDEARGFGLGLAICRKIVHLHGGTLTIASRLEKGTTTQVDLPSRQNNPKQSVPIASP